MLDRLIFLQYVEHSYTVDRHPAVIDRAYDYVHPGSLFSSISWKFRSGSLAAEFSGIRPSASARYLVTIPLGDATDNRRSRATLNSAIDVSRSAGSLRRRTAGDRA